jgi:hypothetical protein
VFAHGLNKAWGGKKVVNATHRFGVLRTVRYHSNYIHGQAAAAPVTNWSGWNR